MNFFFQIIHFLLLSAVWIFGFLERFTIETIGKLVKKMPQTIVQLFSWTQAFNLCRKLDSFTYQSPYI